MATVLENLRLDPRFKFGYHYPVLLQAMIDLTHGPEYIAAHSRWAAIREPADAYKNVPQPSAETQQPGVLTKEFGITTDPILIDALIGIADELDATIDLIASGASEFSTVFWSSRDPGKTKDGTIAQAIEDIYKLGETPILAIGPRLPQAGKQLHVHLT